MRTKVCAVTIAYNNPGELTHLLESLTSQGSSLSGLIVIDNSDQTHAAENEHVVYLQSRQYQFAHYHKTDKNVGSAGGFRRGMEIAHESGFQWVWLLDQDGFVSPGCLTELLRHAEEGAILCPNIFDIERHFSMPMAYAVNFLGGLYPANWCSTHCQIRAFGTHGALISKKSLDIIGYYDDSLFFVGAEDLDYAYRATEAGLMIVLVLRAKAQHRQYMPSTKLMKLLPRRLLGVTNTHEERSYINTRYAGAFSEAYFVSKRLKWWQFGIALVYSLCIVLQEKITSESGISLKKTLRLWLRCFVCSLRKDWPYSSIDELCLSMLR